MGLPYPDNVAPNVWCACKINNKSKPTEGCDRNGDSPRVRLILQLRLLTGGSILVCIERGRHSRKEKEIELARRCVEVLKISWNTWSELERH